MFTVWTAVTAWGCLVRIDVTASVCTPAMQCVSLRHYAVGLQLLWRSVMTRQRNSSGFLWQYVRLMAMRYTRDNIKYVAALQLSVCRRCGRLIPQGNKSCAAKVRLWTRQHRVTLTDVASQRCKREPHGDRIQCTFTATLLLLRAACMTGSCIQQCVGGTGNSLTDSASQRCNSEHSTQCTFTAVLQNMGNFAEGTQQMMHCYTAASSTARSQRGWQPCIEYNNAQKLPRSAVAAHEQKKSTQCVGGPATH
jgi:hypothetical protein